MKPAQIVVASIFIITLLFNVWSGTTTVVLQNAEEGGYHGCKDSWIDNSLDWPNHENTSLFLLYELCSS